jgi:hypothetical protein
MLSTSKDRPRDHFGDRQWLGISSGEGFRGGPGTVASRWTGGSGAGSVTEILPETADKTGLVDGLTGQGPVLPSQVRVLGQDIRMESGAVINAGRWGKFLRAG